MTGGADAHQGLLVSGRFPELEDALCERVAELKRGDALAPVTIVVGSAAVRTRVGDLVVRRLGAVANLTVATLGRLAADLVAADRGAPPVALTGFTRERLVRRVVSRLAGDLDYFGPVLDRPHFAQALAATLTDLREACVPPDSAWGSAARGRRSSRRGRPFPAARPRPPLSGLLRRAAVARLAGRRRRAPGGGRRCGRRGGLWAQSSCTASTTSTRRRRGSSGLSSSAGRTSSSPSRPTVRGPG